MADSYKGGFVRDALGRLVIIAAGAGLIETQQGGFVRDENHRLVVVGPNGESIGGGVTTKELEELKAEIAQVDTDGTLAANSDTKVASQKATKTFANTKGYLPPLLGPYATGRFLPSGTAVIGTANKGYGARYIAEKAGTIKKLYVPVTTAASNHLNVGIFDDGSASAGNRKVLYESGSTLATAAGWVTLEPNLAVTLGQHFDIGVMFDATTAAIGRFAMTSAYLLGLPTGAITAPGGASPKVGWEYVGTEFKWGGGLNASIEESKFSVVGASLSIPQILALVE